MKIVMGKKDGISTALAAAKAALESGSDAVVIEHESEGVSFKFGMTLSPAFCPVTECSECTNSTCTSSRQRAGAMTIAEAQLEYDIALENLKRKERNIQIAVNAHG